MVRVYFVIPSLSVIGNVIARPEYPPVRLTYRSFTPAQITAVTSESTGEYESMRQLLDRVNQWLAITGEFS